MLSFLKKKGTPDPEQVLRENRLKAAQEWLPIFDIKDNFVYRRDGQIACIVKLQPLNIDLLSKSEQRVRIRSLLEALNSFDYPYQIFITAKPVDLDGYIQRLEELKDQANIKRRRLLDQYIKVASRKASSGEALERNFYIILSMERDKKLGEGFLFEKAREAASNLTGAGLVANVCNEQELRDLYFTFANPVESAVERSPLDNMNLPPLFRG